MINEHGYHEGCWGNLEQWQTLNKRRIETQPKTTNRYTGFEVLNIPHPYEEFPIKSLNDRFASFSRRLVDARSRNQRKVHR